MLKAKDRAVQYASLGDAGRALRWAVADDVPQLRTGSFKPLTHRLGADFQGLTDRMCPVALDSGLCVVLVLSEYLRDDAVLAMVIALQQAGLRIAHPPLVVVSATLLSVVARQSRHEQPSSAVPNTSTATAGHVLFALLDDMLSWALEHQASDLHLNVFRNHQHADVAFTIRSRLHRPEQFAGIANDMMMELLAVAWMRIEGGNGAVFEPLREQQGRLVRWIAGQPVHLRWASIVSQHGPAVTLRLLGRDLEPERQTLAQLGYSDWQLESFERALLASGGAVILAGSVGSGKSTTLATLIRSLPPERKVVTLEDPVEFCLPNAIQCAVTSFGEGSADESRFDLKLRAIKRSAANDVLLGEIRDQGSARALADLLVAGSNVYTTLHAGSALQILHRLRSPMLGICPSLLCVPGVLKLLVYQTLLNELCASCCRSADEWLVRSDRCNALGRPLDLMQARHWLTSFCTNTGLEQSELRFRNPDGCEHCQGNRTGGAGYQGSLMAAEFIEPQRISGFLGWLRQQMEPINHAAVSDQWHGETSQQAALRYVGQGRLDPREFGLRFGDAALAVPDPGYSISGRGC